MRTALIVLMLITGLTALGSGVMLLTRGGDGTRQDGAPSGAAHDAGARAQAGGPPEGAVDARRMDERPPGEPDPGLEGVRLGEFSLIDHKGEPADESILEGHVTVVDFVFSNCPMICPAMTGTMARVQERLADVEGVRFVSFSLDVERDTPERLRTWASKHGADLETWTFVTGRDASAQARIDALLGSVPGFGVQRDPSQMIPLKTGDGKMPNIQHPVHLMLVGPDREVLGIFPYSVEAEIDRLVKRARALASG